MTDYQEEDVLELLNNIFVKCDIHERGVVEIDALIAFLTSQDHTWQGDKRIEDEIRKLLYCDNSTQVITKSYFTSALLNWFKTYFGHEQETREHGPTVPNKTGGKCSSQSSGIGEEEITPTSSSNSIEDHFRTVNFVSDGQSFTSEDVVDDTSFEDRENLQSHIKSTKFLENQVSSLQRINESLESANSSLLAQMSLLEDNYEKEHLKKMESYNQLLEKFKQKEEDLEEKLIMVTEEKKTVTIQLYQYEKENAKLKEDIKKLEKQVDVLADEKKQQIDKTHNLKESFDVLNDLFNKSQGDLEALKVKEESGKNTLEKILEENKTLHSQLESNAVLIQNLKTELTTTCEKLSALQIVNLKSRLECENTPDDSITENSVIIFDSKYSFDNTIPLELSLLSELQDKASDCQYKCDCSKRMPFSPSSTVSSNIDSSSIVEEKSFKDSATMTCKENGESLQITHKDVGISCSIKVMTLKRKILCKMGLCQRQKK